MFDWVYNILYSITRALLNIIYYIMSAVNKISGVEDINFSGNNTDFISYLITSDKVTFAFSIAAVCGFILIILFTVIQIVLSYTKEKDPEPPLQICKKAAKNIFILILVPTFMTIFIVLTNAFVKALYQATMVGSTSISQYMFQIFGEGAANSSGYSFYDTSYSIIPDGACMWDDSNGTHWSYMDMSDFDFFYSYIISGIVLYLLLTTAMMLVERAISIVLLYIISPIVVASSVLDDGAKFKSWRDQVLIKFLTGHGAIIAINIYIMVASLVMDPDLVFFENSSAVNNFMKLLFIVGGAVAVKQVQAVIGNIIQVGAGDKAVAENERASGSMLRSLTSPYRAAKAVLGVGSSVSNFAKDTKQYGFGTAVGSRMGFKTNKDYGGMSQTQRALYNERKADKDARAMKSAEKTGQVVGNILKNQNGGAGANPEQEKQNNANPMDALGAANRRKTGMEAVIDNVNQNANVGNQNK